MRAKKGGNTQLPCSVARPRRSQLSLCRLISKIATGRTSKKCCTSPTASNLCGRPSQSRSSSTRQSVDRPMRTGRGIHPAASQDRQVRSDLPHNSAACFALINNELGCAVASAGGSSGRRICLVGSMCCGPHHRLDWFAQPGHLVVGTPGRRTPHGSVRRCSSQVWASGAPAESQSRSSSTFQRTARPNRTGFGRRPSARRAHTCRTEIPRIFATSAAGTARQADSLRCVALLIPALLRARRTLDCNGTVVGKLP